MSTSRWRMIYDDALETDDGNLDVLFALQIFAIHMFYPCGILIAIWWFGTNAVHCMQLCTPLEAIPRCLVILTIVGGYHFKLRFAPFLMKSLRITKFFLISYLFFLSLYRELV